MKFLHLKYAVEVAKTKSISKASENLFMGQPNLSRAIKELEESIGIEIFDRSPKGIAVTEVGEEFLQYARRILHQIEEVETLYQEGRSKLQKFSACVPRASYISEAFMNFAKSLNKDEPCEIFYKETNSLKTISNVHTCEYNIGILRYQTAFEQYFIQNFKDNGLKFETLATFKYCLLVNKNSELATKDEITAEDLSHCIEIAHGDPYVPSMHQTNVKKAELTEYVDKRICLFERGSQFELLEQVPNTFMWVSPVSKEILVEKNLVQLECSVNDKEYKDILIYRNDYHLSPLDRLFISEIEKSKNKNSVEKK